MTGFVFHDRCFGAAGALFFLFLMGCAQISPPSGGPKDNEPPDLVRAVPADRSTNFRAERILLEFDEYIRSNELSRKLVISPPLEEDPETRIKGRTLILELQEELRPNTTYTFNFGDGIEDITEGNARPSFRYVVSTGEHVDSLSFGGRVKNARTREPESGVLVMLYKGNRDSLPIRSNPWYFGKTGEKGEVTIPNIAEGDYKVFALGDDNFNYRYDLPGESIGFLKERVAVKADDSVTSPRTIPLFQEEEPEQYVRDLRVKRGGKLVLTLKKGAEEVALRPLGGFKKADLIGEKKRGWGDTARFWVREFQDSATLEAEVRVADTVVDTVEALLRERPSDASLEARTNESSPFDIHEPFRLTFAHPISSFDSTAARLVVGGDSSGSARIERVEGSRRAFRIPFQWRDSIEHEVLIPNGTFRDHRGLTNDSLRFSFETRYPEYYGQVTLNYELPEKRGGRYLLHLLKGDRIEERRVIRKKGDSAAVFRGLQPGDHSIEVIHDRNGNGRWDPGNYLEAVQPERVWRYSKGVKVRSNWELDITWELKERDRP